MPRHRKLSTGSRMNIARWYRWVPQRWGQVALGVITIAAFATVCYWQSLDGGFILDDDGLITKSPVISYPDGLYKIWCTNAEPDYWPLTYSTFYFEWRIFGLNSVGYHAVNLGLHITSALLVWLVLRQLKIPVLIWERYCLRFIRSTWPRWRGFRSARTRFRCCFFCYQLWPICAAGGRLGARRHWTNRLLGRTTSKILLAAPRALSRLPSRGGGFKSVWYWLSFACFVLAVLSKGSVLILPALLLLITWWERPLAKSDLARMIPFFVVAIIFTIVNIRFQIHASGEVIRHVNFAQRLVGAAAAVWFYLSKALLPIDLAFVYPHWNIDLADFGWWIALIAALGATGLLFRQRNTRWGKPLFFAWMFYCFALVPVMGLTDTGYMKFTLVADHYQYIPLIAVTALAGAVASSAFKHPAVVGRVLAGIAVVAGIVSLAVLCWQQDSLFRSVRTLYEDAVAKNPDTNLLYDNLGEVLQSEYEYDAAKACFEKAIELDPDCFSAHFDLGRLLDKRYGRLNEAMAQYRETLRIQPENTGALDEMAHIYERLNRPAEALAAGEMAKQIAIKGGFTIMLDKIEEWEKGVRALPGRGASGRTAGGMNLLTLIPIAAAYSSSSSLAITAFSMIVFCTLPGTTS